MVTKRMFIQLLGGRVDLMRRLLYAEDHGILTSDGFPWVQTVIRGTSGRERMLDTDSCLRAYARIKGGELPPLLPSAQRNRPKILGSGT